MFSCKPQLGFNGCSALGLHRVADLPARACFLETLEAREFLPLLSIGKLNYPGDDGNIAGVHLSAIGRTGRASG